MVNDKYLLVVVGATAVGKTATCIKLARSLNAEIVSADSRQFYREMEIGTAKPDEEELNAAKHHFINSHSITEDISAGEYEFLALVKLNDLFEKHKFVILTGGSGLYIDAVTQGFADIPKIDPSVREELNASLASKGIDHLVERLKALDPDYYDKVDKKNPHRVMRALEVCIGTGKPYSQQRKPPKKDRPFQIIKIGLELPREALYERINTRMDKMIEQGLFDEAKQLEPYKNHNALQTVGYKEIFDYFDGKYDKEEAVRLLKRNTRRYAKRQMTWFKRDQDIRWYSPDDYQKIIAYVESVT